MKSLRHACRAWRRRPAFFVIATVSLGLALAICSATFSLIDTVIHPVVPYAHPGRTIIVARAGNPPSSTALDESMRAIRTLPEFEAVASLQEGVPTNILIGETNDQSVVAQVAANAFDVLGVAALRGRLFTEADARAGNTVIVNAAFWRRWFQQQQDMSNATITFGGRTYTIIGVVASSVTVPSGDAEIWQPLRPASAEAGTPTIAARLRSGVTFEHAQTVLSQTAGRFNTEHASPQGLSYTIRYASGLPPHLGGPYLLMLGLAGLLLLIACANLAALTLARNLARQRDIAVRIALGARLRELITDQLAEIAVVSVAGGGLGVLLGSWIATMYAQWMPPLFAGASVALEPRVNGFVLLCTLGAVCATMVLTVLLPAVGLKQMRPIDQIKDNAATTTGRAGSDLRKLVLVELTVTMALLFVAGLFLRSAEHVNAFDLGFDPRGLRRVTGVVYPPGDTVVFGAMGVENDLVARLRATPGVAGATSFMGGQWGVSTANTSETIDAHTLIDGVTHAAAGADVMAILGIPLVAGRDLRESDIHGEGAAIVDEQLATTLFPHGDALGQRIQLSSSASKSKWIPVVGIARAAFLDLPMRDRPGFREKHGFVISAAGPRAPRLWNILVRLDPSVPSAPRAIQDLLRLTIPVQSVSSISQFSQNIEDGRRVYAFLTYVFGVLALSGLVLAAIGVLGVVSYSVDHRMREFGVRIALGAQAAAIHRLVLRDGLRMAAASVVVGGLGGGWLGTALSRELYGVPAVDAMSFCRAAIVLVCVTLVACLVPAIRASRSNPLDILRAT